MRVLFFSESAGVHEERFLRKLAGSRHQVWFLPLLPADQPGRQVEGIHFLPSLMPVRSFASQAMIEAAEGLKGVVSQVRPDMIHAGPLPSCGFVASLAGEPRIMAMSWGWDLLDPELSGEQRCRTLQALRGAAMACCDCQTLREAIERQAPNLVGRVSVFPWGVELDRFHPGAAPRGLRSQRGWQHRRIVLSTRSLEPLYGARTLVRAALEAQAASPNLRFVFAGDGSLLVWAEESVQAAGADDAFCFLGRVPESEMPGLFAEADLYMSGSRTDGSSISLLQAFASGLPVAVTDLPANREWVRPTENGWLTPFGDPDQLAAVLKEVAAMEPAALRKFGANNLQVARQRADWNVNFAILLQGYGKIAAGTSCRSSIPDPQDVQEN
jgi:glycosyltransferase involved in cell wall biosynthesis